MRLPIDYASATEEQRDAAVIQAVLELAIVLRVGTLQARARPPEGSPTGKDSVAVPPRFWRQLSDRELGPIVMTGKLDAGVCVRLWECLKRRSQPPMELRLVFKRSEVLRAFARTEATP